MFFVDQWSLYRKVVDADFMEHRRFRAAIHQVLAGRSTPFDVLDLGCGDGSNLAAALEGTRVRAWEGVDLSPAALESARQTMSGRPWTATVRQGDLGARLAESLPGVVFSSYALHHLATEQKAHCLSLLAEGLPSDGMFLLLDLVRRDGEERAAYLARYAAEVQNWTGLTPEEKASIDEHMATCDFPETVTEMASLGRRSGFLEVELLLQDPRELFGLYRFAAARR